MITCHVERAPHIPYRESKVTRLMQEGMKALKEKMFEEVSSELNEKSVELEATNAKLSEHTLECTQEVLEKTVSEREVQKHFVEKHVETEVALKGQAKKLLETSEVSSKDLKLVHDKSDRLKIVEEINAEVKGEFKDTFQNSFEEIVQNLETYGSGHKTDCSNLQQQLKLHLKTRAEHLNSLGETLNQLVSDQAKSIGDLNDMREEMSKSVTEYLTKQKKGIQSIAIVDPLMPGLSIVSSCVLTSSMPSVTRAMCCRVSIMAMVLNRDRGQLFKQDSPTMGLEENFVAMKVVPYLAAVASQSSFNLTELTEVLVHHSIDMANTKLYVMRKPLAEIENDVRHKLES